MASEAVPRGECSRVHDLLDTRLGGIESKLDEVGRKVDALGTTLTEVTLVRRIEGERKGEAIPWRYWLLVLLVAVGVAGGPSAVQTLAPILKGLVQ